MAVWQQQMQLMESFHHDMIMMVQMFVAMHKEHSATVRQELERIQQLTRELSDLQSRSSHAPKLENSGPPADRDRPLRRAGPVQSAIPMRHETKTRLEQTDKLTERPKKEPEARSRPSGKKIPPVNAGGPGTADKTRDRETSEVHGDLTQRITQLQRERQGYWQSILKTISR